ncbi:MAG TPA: glycosyltransferase family 2 protein, partial [Chloroflexota bacterium]|nr:glycosyltransferase family 2 protein [Chloroflexota bacterium]
MTGADKKCAAAMPRPSDHGVAVLIPCFNEDATIGKVVADFRAALPDATIYVYDNNSTDRTADVARKAGAIVRSEILQGKGNVVRTMFADIDADIYVLVDGDDTYDATCAPTMVSLLADNRLDLVSGSRISSRDEAYRRGHRAGNIVITKLVAWIFGPRFRDMLSGYKVLSRRFVKSFPIMTSRGFEIETEITIHALELNMPTREIGSPYKERPTGSVSKLRTYRDGLRIVWAIFLMVKDERPLVFFSLLSVGFVGAALVLAIPI